MNEILDIIINVLKSKNEIDTAYTLLKTFEKHAHNMAEFDALGKCFYDIKKYNDSLACVLKTYSMAESPEQLYSVRANMAKLYNHLNDPANSLRYLKLNEMITPDNFEIKLEQVFALFLLNQKDKSKQILLDILARSDVPEDVRNRCEFNMGTYDLYDGKFQKGLEGFILGGRKLNIWKEIDLPYPKWDGSLNGQTVLIVAEGGIGDEIINVRFVEHLKNKGLRPIWFTTRADVADIFSKNGINVITSLEPAKLPADVVWEYSMKLPILLNVSETELYNAPYLKPSATAIEKWKHLESIPGKKIGIRWTGNPHYEQDLHRSVPLSLLVSRLQDRGTLISLQKDDGADQVLEYPDIIDLSSKLDTIDDTMAVIHHLDLVITSCTSVAHMAAAMGKETYIFAPITAYYTWASTTDQSTIWYGNNVKILRQTVHKSWNEPLLELEDLLNKNIVN